MHTIIPITIFIPYITIIIFALPLPSQLNCASPEGSSGYSLWMSDKSSCVIRCWECWECWEGVVEESNYCWRVRYCESSLGSSSLLMA